MQFAKILQKLKFSNNCQFFPACRDEFDVLLEQHAEYAYPVYEIETEDGCADLCREIDECLAFDHDHNNPPFRDARCWIHDVQGRPIIPVEGVDHYIRKPCDFPSSMYHNFTATSNKKIGTVT